MMTGSDYLTLYQNSPLDLDNRQARVLDYVCRTALLNESLYRAVQVSTGVPWCLVAAIHYRESDQSFRCHLHNGDPLTARTVHEPAGRPIAGTPPFPWQVSAADALAGSWRPNSWDLPGALQFLERYNGLGYQKHAVNTPYLWDWTAAYRGGLYAADGTFNARAREDRAGCVAILKTLFEKGVTL